ncbi:MAG: hypothetical protein JO283_02500 [Bradyrhizobium sp.]|nr:hypothetical protein [Bradyrhizobium sp.]
MKTIYVVAALALAWVGALATQPNSITRKGEWLLIAAPTRDCANVHLTADKYQSAR